MFDKTFFKFAIGFTTIIAVSLCAIYFMDTTNSLEEGTQTAEAR